MLKNVWLLQDGHLEFNRKIFFGEDAEDERVQIPVNAFLIQLEKRLVLIDAGCGAYFGPNCGYLEKAIKESGHSITDVTDILLTHLHPDHIGGIPLFPQATLYISAKEWDYWFGPLQEKNMTERNKKYHPFVQKTITEHPRKIVQIEPGPVGIPGITALAAYGHTPGHTAFLLERENQTILFWGDTASKLQINCPEKPTLADHDPKQAINTRFEFFKRVSSHNYLTGGAHITAFGHLIASPSGFTWKAS